jgi:hypothetical protein
MSPSPCGIKFSLRLKSPPGYGEEGYSIEGKIRVVLIGDELICLILPALHKNWVFISRIIPERDAGSELICKSEVRMTILLSATIPFHISLELWHGLLLGLENQICDDDILEPTRCGT